MPGLNRPTVHLRHSDVAFSDSLLSINASSCSMIQYNHINGRLDSLINVSSPLHAGPYADDKKYRNKGCDFIFDICSSLGHQPMEKTRQLDIKKTVDKFYGVPVGFHVHPDVFLDDTDYAYPSFLIKKSQLTKAEYKTLVTPLSSSWSSDPNRKKIDYTQKDSRRLCVDIIVKKTKDAIREIAHGTDWKPTHIYCDNIVPDFAFPAIALPPFGDVLTFLYELRTAVATRLGLGMLFNLAGVFGLWDSSSYARNPLRIKEVSDGISSEIGFHPIVSRTKVDRLKKDFHFVRTVIGGGSIFLLSMGAYFGTRTIVSPDNSSLGELINQNWYARNNELRIQAALAMMCIRSQSDKLYVSNTFWQPFVDHPDADEPFIKDWIYWPGMLGQPLSKPKFINTVIGGAVPVSKDQQYINCDRSTVLRKFANGSICVHLDRTYSSDLLAQKKSVTFYKKKPSFVGGIPSLPVTKRRTGRKTTHGTIYRSSTLRRRWNGIHSAIK